MNFIKYLTWNIKKYKKLIFNIFISILIGFVFSGCKVQAVSRSDYISLESTYTRKARELQFFNNVLNEYYGRNDIDLSEFSNINNISSFITSKDYYSALIPEDNNKIWVRISMDPMYFYISQSSGGYTFVGNWIYCIDIDNKTVISTGQDDNYLTKASVEYKDIITSEKWYSDEFQEFLLYNYVLFYNGEIKNRERNKILNYEQKHNKNTFWDYTEDGIYSYWSGDIVLYEDYFEIKDFETNVSEYSMYLLQYSVVPNEFGEYVLTNSYSRFEIGKPNQGTATWQISNISDSLSGDNIYSIGIGTTDTPSLIRSEWFDSDDNLSNFMNSKSFRLRYYVENLPEFFIPTESSGSGDSEIIPPSGDDTEIVGGIKGIWQAVLNLPKMILDGLVGLFVPSEGFFSSYFDELLTWFEERLGILGYPITFTVDVLNRILDLDFNEPVISWDDMYVPLFEDEVPLIPAGEINFKTLVESNETILNFYNTYLIIVDGLLVFMIIKLIQRKHDEIVGGASE